SFFISLYISSCTTSHENNFSSFEFNLISIPFESCFWLYSLLFIPPIPYSSLNILTTSLLVTSILKRYLILFLLLLNPLPFFKSFINTLVILSSTSVSNNVICITIFNSFRNYQLRDCIPYPQCFVLLVGLNNLQTLYRIVFLVLNIYSFLYLISIQILCYQ